MPPVDKALILAREIVQEFRWAIDACNITTIPTLVKRLLRSEAWKKRFEYRRTIVFEKFEDFVTKAVLDGGCGWEPDQVESLLKKSGDEEALRMWRAAMKAQTIAAQAPELQPVGRPSKENVSDKKDDENISTGTAEYAIRRLRRDRPDILDRVLAGEITPNAGMIEAGFRKPAKSRRKSLVERALKLVEDMTPDQRQEFFAAVKKFTV